MTAPSRRRLAAFAASATLAVAGSACRARPEASPAARSAATTKPSLLLVSIDTLRADRLSLYGYPRPTSPRLDELARESIVFDRFYYNGGGTLPSHMSLFTSLHPATHGIGPESTKTLEPERVTLAEALGAAGYATAAFTDGGWIAGKFGFAQGFDRYYEGEGGFDHSLPLAEEWLARRDRSRPFFLFLHSYDVHSTWKTLPYDCAGDAELKFARPPASGFAGCKKGLCASRLLADANEKIRAGEAQLSEILDDSDLAFISDLYDGCVRWTDERLGLFFDGLRRSGLWENTVVVVLSDHGEEFGEHGAMLHDQGGYEELARVPLLVKPARAAAAGRRVDGLAAMVDVLPTLLDMLELESPGSAQGRSLLPAIAAGHSRRPAIHMYSVLRNERFKYFSDERKLFDLAADPRETANLYLEQPARAAEFERTVRSLIAADHAAAASFARVSSPGPGATLSEEELARLRSLGYLK